MKYLSVPPSLVDFEAPSQLPHGTAGRAGALSCPNHLRQPLSAQATPCLPLTRSTNAVEHLGLIRCAHVPRRLGIDRQLLMELEQPLMDAIAELAL